MKTKNLKPSQKYSLNLLDFAKGLLIAFLSAVIASIGLTLEAGELPGTSELILAGKTGFAAGVSYLMKNFVATGDQNKLINQNKLK